MTNKITDYIKLAESATEGPWIIADDDGRKNIRINMLTEIVPEYSPNKQLVTVSCTAWRDHHATAKHNAQFIAASRDFAPALAKALLEVEEALVKAKRKHIECEDCWYSCPKSEGGCCNEAEPDICNCGADKANKNIDQALAQIQRIKKGEIV